MTTYYVDSGRPDDTGNGLTIATAKKTLNGAEDIPVAAGDLVHVRQGTYRETLTIDVSGTAGNAIEYRGDYTGVIFGDAFGAAPVRITGSDNDQTATRANCLTVGGAVRNYRTITGFLPDTVTGVLIQDNGSGTNLTVQNCVLGPGAQNGDLININGTGTGHTIQNCILFGGPNANSITIQNASTVNDTATMIQNCLFVGGNRSIGVTRIGGITVRNCVATTRIAAAMEVITALAVGQVLTINNCIFDRCLVAVKGTATTDITENYNTFSGNGTDRVNTNTGANSVSYPPLFDPRWALQLMYAQAAAQLVSPFDLASFSQLVNLAGTSPSTTDLRGQAIIGAQREWGALEYNPALKKMGQMLRPYG